jgi:hypothetical protein
MLKRIRAMKALGKPADNWDTRIMHPISSRSDYFTQRKLEALAQSCALTVVKDLRSFLQQRCQILEVAVSPFSQLNNSQKPTEIQSTDSVQGIHKTPA